MGTERGKTETQKVSKEVAEATLTEGPMAASKAEVRVASKAAVGAELMAA